MDIFNSLFGDNFGPESVSNAPHEAPAELRQAASTLFSLYSSMMEAGFSEDQALELVKTMLAAAIPVAGQ